MRFAADIAYLIIFTLGEWLLALAFTTRSEDGFVFFFFGRSIVFVVVLFSLLRVIFDRIHGRSPSAISLGALIGVATCAIIGATGLLNSIVPFAGGFAYPLTDRVGVSVGIAIGGTAGAYIGAVRRWFPRANDGAHRRSSSPLPPQ